MDRQHFKFDRPLHQLIVIGYHLTGSEGKGWLRTTLLRVSKRRYSGKGGNGRNEL